MSKTPCPIGTLHVSFYANHLVTNPRSMRTIFQGEALLNKTMTSLAP